MTEPRYITEARNMAAAVRHQMHLGLEAVANIFHLMEEFGLPVARRDMGTDGPDGIYANSGRVVVAVINTSRPRNRQRFTAGHELGHHVFDSDAGLQVDQDIFQMQNLQERRANAFAAHFLMPEDGIRSLLSKDSLKSRADPQDVVHLAYHFGVSNQAIIYQLHNLNIIRARERDRFLEMDEDGSLIAIAWKCGYSPARSQQPGSHGEKLRLPADFIRRAIDAYTSSKISLSRLAELLERSDVEVLEQDLLEANLIPVAADVDEYREDVEHA
ncbi:hypothetical protein BMS3Abin01_00616 [bacterium BMS3Abin01]|nr:hypothetical protein BMS3Abin01_00616 [bacterium BMS3Abin01]